VPGWSIHSIAEAPITPNSRCGFVSTAKEHYSRVILIHDIERDSACVASRIRNWSRPSRSNESADRGHSGIDRSWQQERASVHRPSERRDWDADSRRVADHAFGARARWSSGTSSPCVRTCSGSRAGEDASSSSASTCLSGAAWVSDGEPPASRLGGLSRQQSVRRGR
jgi:hypothetical protein